MGSAGMALNVEMLTFDCDNPATLAAGATGVGRHQFGDSFRWVVPADLEGNVFCVVRQ